MSPPDPCRSELAPGGVPTMVVNDNAASLTPRGVLRFIASRLAPTRDLRWVLKVVKGENR
jgi:hypothetical protein